MKTTLLGIAIPAYNAGRFLMETLTSVSKVIVPESSELHVVLINDCSTDNTEEIAKNASYSLDWGDKVFRILSNETNKGESYSSQRGIDEIQPDFFIILSADDLVDAEIFLKLLPHLEQTPNTVAVYPDWTMLNERSETLDTECTDEWTREKQYGGAGNIPGPGTLIRYSTWKESGGRNPYFHFYSDLEQWFRLGLLGEIRRVPFRLAYWRTHSTNQSRTTKLDKMLSEMKALTYGFELWSSPLISHLETSAKVSTRIRCALAAIPNSPKLRDWPQVHGLFALMLWIKLKSQKETYWGPKLGFSDIVVVAFFPISKYVIRS